MFEVKDSEMELILNETIKKLNELGFKASRFSENKKMITTAYDGIYITDKNNNDYTMHIDLREIY